MRRISIVRTFVYASSLALGSVMIAAPRALGAQNTTASPRGSAIEAHTQMKNALAKARSEKKMVLIKFSASWCGPCHAFDKFLYDTTGTGAIMQKYFVIVGMTALEFPPKDTLDTPGAIQLALEMGGDLKRDTGIPYFFMLGADGKKTGDSKFLPDHSNMGDPATPVEVESFDRLLQVTAPRMTPDERARVKKFLDTAAGR